MSFVSWRLLKDESIDETYSYSINERGQVRNNMTGSISDGAVSGQVVIGTKLYARSVIMHKYFPDDFEIWYPLNGFPRYSITKSGKVRNEHDGKVLKACIKVSGAPNFTKYFGFCLTIGGERNKDRLLHRLLALQFIPNPNNYPQVDHKDRNHFNNDLDNLRWATLETQAENKRYKQNPLNKILFVGRYTLNGKKKVIKSKSREEVQKILDEFAPNNIISFVVNFRIDKKPQSKSFKTLEEAVVFRDSTYTE